MLKFTKVCFDTIHQNKTIGEIMKIAIIGGGISGLATAFYIKQKNPNIELCIYEKRGFLGGKMKTVNAKGFLFEEGSNGFLSNKPDTLELVKESGCEDLLMPSNDNARIRFIFKDALHRLPESPKAFLATPLLSLKEKIRVAMEIFIPKKDNKDDETLQSFGYRRVGAGMTDTFLDAMVAGIYASTPDKISVNAAFPAVVRLEQEYGGLFKGMIAKKKKEAGPGGILMSFKGGVTSFIERLAIATNSKIILNSNIMPLIKNGDKFEINCNSETELFDKVIFCTPAYETANLAQNIFPQGIEILNNIEYSPISVVGLGYENLSHDLLGFGLLTTTSANKEILGVLWDSSIFEDRAPHGKKSLRVMIGGQRNAQLALKSDDELIEIAKRGVKETMQISDEPSVIYVKKWEKGIPNYPVGHLKKMDELFSMEKETKNIYLNSNAYVGIGLNDCISNCKKCADKVLES